MRTLLFDTETTDLLPNSLLPVNQQPRVIEFFGHVIEEDGTVVKDLEFRCNPGIKLDPKISKITGIVDADLVNQPPFGMNTNLIQQLFGMADRVAAHNLSYDYAVMNIEFDRLDKKLIWPAIKVCTVEETEFIKGHRLKLSDLHMELFGEGFTGAHRAREDVWALTRCWLKLAEMEFV